MIEPTPENFYLKFRNKLGIESVSYFSDGKAFNATFWLPSEFINNPSEYISAYSIVIDVDSDNKTGSHHGQGGADYTINVTWNPTTKKWEKIFTENSESETSRILNKSDNYVNFFGRDYMTMSADLDAIGSPDQFLVTFEVSYEFLSPDERTLLGGNNWVTDILPWVSIPEPEFVTTLSPSTLTIKPGENKIVEVIIDSNVNLKSIAALYTENRTGSIESSFAPPEVTIPPNGIGSSYLYLEASDDAPPQTLTFRIYQSLSFPATYLTYENATTNIGTYLTVTLQDYPFSEKFKDFWSAYGDAISLVGGGFAGGFAGFIFARLEKKKSNDGKI
jgi:hypothetical protein